MTFQCEICEKEFNKKFNLDRHLTNKKEQCRPKPHKTPQNPTENDIIINDKSKVNNDNKLTCIYCGLCVSRKDHLKRHIDNFCKAKKDLDNEKEKMFRLLIEEKDKQHEKELNKRDGEIKELKQLIVDQNNKINELIKKMTPSTITNINNNNNIIVNTGLKKFGHENIEDLRDKEYFVRCILYEVGSNAFEACADKIYNDSEHPENQTVYCTDLSREKFMIFDGENWILATKNEVLGDVQNKIQEYIDIHEEELEERLEKDSKFRERFVNKLKKFYLKYYGNIQEKEKAFEEKTDKQLIRFFYKIKDEVRENFDRLYNKALELEVKKKMITNDSSDDSEGKKRGRPKKNI